MSCIVSFVISILVFPKVARAHFFVVDPQGNRGSYQTATFTHVSEKDNVSYFNQQAVFVDGLEKEMSSSIVQGKVVVSDTRQADIWPWEAAKMASQAGAIAYVLILQHDPPGVFCNAHPSFDPKMDRSGIPFVDIARGSVGIREIERWRSTAMAGYTVTLTPRHSTSYQDLFSSPWWIVFMQVVLPVFAFSTTYTCIQEIFRLKMVQQDSQHGQQTRRENAIGPLHLIFCVVHAAACFVIGVALVCGQFGPLWLPFSFHWAMNTLLLGCSSFTTILLALLVRDKRRNVSFSAPPAQTPWRRHRCTVCSCGFLFVGGDVLTLLLSLDARFLVNLRLLFLAYGITQGAVGMFFLLQAHALTRPLFAYVNHSESHPGAERAAQIFRLAFWLRASGVAMLLNVASIVVAALMHGDYHTNGPEPYVINVFAISASRICTSLCQVHVLKPSAAQGIFSCMRVPTQPRVRPTFQPDSSVLAPPSNFKDVALVSHPPPSSRGSDSFHVISSLTEGTTTTLMPNRVYSVDPQSTEEVVTTAGRIEIESQSLRTHDVQGELA